MISIMAESEFQHIATFAAGDNVVLTVLEQRLDSELVTDALRQELFAAVTSAPPNVVLNLHNVKMMHTLALQTLLELRKKVLAKKGRIVLCGLSPSVTMMLEITAFIDGGGSPHALFEAYPDVPSALARLNAAL